MTEQTFDAMTQRVAGISRRQSLLTLGGAGLTTALAGRTLGVEAKSTKKKCKKQTKKCKKFIKNYCEGDQDCLNTLQPCCSPCKVDKGVKCVVNAFSSTM